MTTIKVIKNYQDMQLGRKVIKNETIEVSNERAEQIVKAGFAKIIKVVNVSTETPTKPKTVKRKPRTKKK